MLVRDDDPSTLTPEQRLIEIAALFVQAVRRLHGRPPGTTKTAPLDPNSPQNCLEFGEHTRPHGPTG